MQNLYRLANIMGLDTENTQHSSLLKESAHGIVDIDDFLEYCRGRKDGIEYMNRVEKLDLLATQYKKSSRNMPKDIQELLPKYCKQIDGKFKQAISFIRDNEEALNRHLERLKPNGEQWFTNKEIDSLQAIGGLRNCITAYEEGKLYEKLYDVSVKRYLEKKKYNALTDGQKRIKKLMQ